MLSGAAHQTTASETTHGWSQTAAIAGFADTHATAVSMACQVAAGKMAARDACVPILVGFSTNSITKIGLAFASGRQSFAFRVVPRLLIVLAATWLGVVVAP